MADTRDRWTLARWKKQEAAGTAESATGNETDQQQEEADTEEFGRRSHRGHRGDATGQQSEYIFDPQRSDNVAIYSCTHCGTADKTTANDQLQ